MSTEKKADFSGVTGSVDSTAEQVPKADFSGVSASVDSTAEVVDATYTVEKGDTLFLTEAAKAGASLPKMQEVSRQKKVEVLLGYVRDAALFENHAGESFL